MNKNNALLQIVNPEKDLNFQHENIQTIVDQMENELLLQSGMVWYVQVFGLFWTRGWSILPVLYSFFRPSLKMFLEQQNLSRHLIELGGSYKLFIQPCWQIMSIIRRLTIGLMRFLIHRRNPSICIDQWMTNSASEMVERNRRFLKSILRALEYLGR